jgi:hypothetical protein
MEATFAVLALSTAHGMSDERFAAFLGERRVRLAPRATAHDEVPAPGTPLAAQRPSHSGREDMDLPRRRVTAKEPSGG